MKTCWICQKPHKTKDNICKKCKEGLRGKGEHLGGTYAKVQRDYRGDNENSR